MSGNLLLGINHLKDIAGVGIGRGVFAGIRAASSAIGAA